jgi:exonuclease III
MLSLDLRRAATSTRSSSALEPSWWNFGIGYARNLGMRIDVIAADRDLAARLETTSIDHAERGLDRPSDHAALVAGFDLDSQPDGCAPANHE